MKTIPPPVTLLVFCCVFLPCCLQAQGKKFDNPQWKTIEMLEFKHDKMDRAKEIIQNYFIKAANKAGSRQPALLLQAATGDWSMVVVWNMKEGLDELNWETNPDDVKWMNAMNEIAGGSDKAKAILDEWSSLVVHSTSYLCRQF